MPNFVRQHQIMDYKPIAFTLDGLVPTLLFYCSRKTRPGQVIFSLTFRGNRKKYSPGVAIQTSFSELPALLHRVTR